MRPGPSLKDLLGPVKVGVQVRVTRGRQTLAENLPASNARLEYASDRVVPGRLTYDLPASWAPAHPLAPANNYGQRSEVTISFETGGRVYETPLGQFIHESWGPVSGDTFTVEALDLMQIPECDPMVWPSSPPEGATLISEMQRLATLRLPVKSDLYRDPIIQRGSQWGTSRTEAIRDLAASQGVEYGVKADGCLHVWKPDNAGLKPAAYYTGKDLLVEAPATGFARRPNRFLAVGKKDKEEWVAWADRAGVPFDKDYGVITQREEISAPEAYKDVQAAANKAMRESMGALKKRSLGIVPDPRLEAGDVIGISTPAGEEIVGRVVAYSLPLGGEEPMRVDLEEFTW